MKKIPRGTNSVLRQRLCAIEVVRLMNDPRSKTLHPLPFLPYTIGLALSVSYQHLRQSQLEHQQADARQDFAVCCRILQSIRRTWSSADVLATLAKKVLDELERAPDLSVFRVSRVERQAPEAAEVAVADSLIQPPTACKADVRDPDLAISADHGTDAENVQVGLPEAGTARTDSQLLYDGLNLLENVDDLLGTFMDPNHPNFDASTFLEDLVAVWPDEGFGVG